MTINQSKPEPSSTIGISHSSIDFSLKPRNNLQLLLGVSVVLLVDLGSLRPSLLLCLPNFTPLFHCQMLAQFGELVGLQSKAFQKRAVVDWVEDHVVVGSVPFY
jgi:hypothetical protein